MGDRKRTAIVTRNAAVTVRELTNREESGQGY